MSFHYCREPGEEGQILTEDGEAPGMDLSVLLDQGPLPVKAALELVAFLADLVSIAEEDEVVHGDLKPGYIKIDGAGAVSIEGFGITRRGGRAPEGKPVGIATDTYGLGVILHAVLSGESFGAVPRDRDGHDDAIVDRLMGIDWQDLSDRKWMDDLMHFMCAMLAFDPHERPAPLDVANVLFQVTEQIEGDGMAEWAPRAVRAAGGGAGRPQAAVAEEDLSGPKMLGTPVTNTGALKLRQAASAKGEATAFWSREKIAAMLAEEEVEDYPRAAEMAYEEPTGVSPGLFDQPVSGRSRAQVDDYPTSLATPQSAPEPPPVAPPPPRAEPPSPPAAPPPAAPRPVAPVASQTPFATQGPVAHGPAPAAPPQPAYSPQPFAAQGAYSAPPQEKKGGGALKWVVLGAFIVGILACIGFGGAGGVFYMFSGDPEAKAPEEVKPTADPVKTQVDTATPAAGSDAAEGKGGSSSKGSDSKGSSTKGSSTKGSSSGSSSSGSSSSGSSSSGSSTKSSGSGSSGSGSSGSRTSSASSGSSSSGTRSSSSGSSSTSSGSSTSGSSSAAAAGGPFEVKFVAQGKEALLQCGDGQQVEFVGSTRLSFAEVTTCRIKVDEVMGVVQARQTSTVACSVQGGKVVCTGA